MLERYYSYLVWVIFSILSGGNLIAEKGVHFEMNLNWQQIQAKAKAESKYIFVDCFATWCGPCKEMDGTTYQAENVANFINNRFVCIRIQMDSTKQDNEQVKSLYTDANVLRKKYAVQAYPSFLFFSPDGRIIHRGFGYMNEDEFMTLVKNALDPKKQYYTLLASYREGKRDYVSLPYLLQYVQTFENRRLADSISADYVHNYLYRLPDDDLYARKNIEFLRNAIRSSAERGFNLFYRHEEKIDQIVGRKKYAEAFVDNIIYKEQVYQQLWKEGKPLDEIPDWDNLMEVIAKKYNMAYAESVILNGQVRWYSASKNWPEFAKYGLIKIEREGLDTTYLGMTAANNFMYSIIFMNVDDKEMLTQALYWQETMLKRNPNDANLLDTYANLLYKLGRRQDAIENEKKASVLDPKDNVIQANFDKMKSGKPTWSKK